MSFSRPGALDLSRLAQPATPNTAGAAAGASGSFAVDVSMETFQQIVEASAEYVVVLSLWSARSPQSESFNQTLSGIADSMGGQLLLAKVDVDANPQIAQAIGAQGVPTVVGIVKGQPVPLFQGTADETEIRHYFNELVKVATQNGVSGRAPSQGAAEVEEEPVDDPRFAAADTAFAAGDFDTAIAEYEKLQTQHPAETEIAERLAGVRLLARTKDVDLQAARIAAANAPDDVEAQLLVADLDVSGGHVEDAFVRLIDLIKVLPPDERNPIRERLVELFTVVGITDPRVAAARRTLAAALF